MVECDVSRLPFPNETFDVVTCSHAFYELKGETQDLALKEITRVLTPNGVFLMMEHDVPLNPIVRLLFYIRLASMGALGAISFLRHEEQVLESHFGSVSKVLAPAGRSKVMACKKALRGLAAVGMPSESALPQEGRH